MAQAADRPALPAAVRACLFDMDGVLTDTASVHEAAWKQTFDAFLRSREGESFRPFGQEDYNAYVDGEPRIEGTRGFLASRGISLPEGDTDDPAGSMTVCGLSNRKNALVLTHFQRYGVTVFETSAQFVRQARAQGRGVGVVSASENAAEVLSLAGIADLFDVRIDGVVARDRNLAGKPAPDTYLAAADALGVPAQQAAVFEDAVAGVAAGRAGGFGFVVGVDRVGHADALRDNGADLVVTDLGELLGVP
jgi:beta-phosphoglucomutase family hydrolase